MFARNAERRKYSKASKDSANQTTLPFEREIIKKKKATLARSGPIGLPNHRPCFLDVRKKGNEVEKIITPGTTGIQPRNEFLPFLKFYNSKAFQSVSFLLTFSLPLCYTRQFMSPFFSSRYCTVRSVAAKPHSTIMASVCMHFSFLPLRRGIHLGRFSFSVFLTKDRVPSVQR